MIAEKQNIEDINNNDYSFFLDNHLDKSVNTLVIGCGAGYQSLKFADTIDIDIDIDCLRVCRDKGLSKLILADASHLPIKAAAVPQVLMSDVIEHFPSKSFLCHVVQEVNRTLVANGKAVIIMPLRDNILPIRKIYNSIMRLPTPIMAIKGHTLSLSKGEILKAFGCFNLVGDGTWLGSFLGICLPLIGGEYAFLAYQKANEGD